MKKEFSPKLAMGAYGTVIGGILTVSYVGSVVFMFLNGSFSTELPEMQYIILQFAMQIFGILLPPLLFVLIGRYDLRETLSLRTLSLAQVLVCLALGGAVVFGGNYLNNLYLAALEAIFGELNIPDIFGGSPLYTVLMSVSSVIVAPIAEEVCFRGVVFKGLSSRSTTGAILLSALFFGLFHLTYFQVFYAFVVGLYMALAVHFTRSIWSSVLVHFSANVWAVLLTVIELDTDDFLVLPSALEIVETACLAVGVLTVGGLLLLWLYRLSCKRNGGAPVWKRGKYTKIEMLSMILFGGISLLILILQALQ